MEGNIFDIASEFLMKWVPIATQVIGSFAVIAAATPTKTDDKIVQFILDLVHFLGGNFGKAKNRV